MKQRKQANGMVKPEDRKTMMTVIGFVYSPLALLAGTAAALSL